MVDVVKQLAEQTVGKIAKQHEARQQLSRAEVSKLVAKANKRVARLERNNLESRSNIGGRDKQQQQQRSMSQRERDTIIHLVAGG